MTSTNPLKITRSDPARVEIEWDDQHRTVYSAAELRRLCPCARCVDEQSGRRTLKPESIPDDMTQVALQLVGNYAISVRFSVRDSLVLGEWRRATLLARLAARLTKGGELVLHASRFRERHRNEEDARERLAVLLRKALQAPKKRVPTRPTRGSRERRLADKRRRSERKRDRRGSEDS